MALKTSTVKLDFAKSTAGTHVYHYTGPDKASQAVSAIYVNKSAFDGAAPPVITVTVAEPQA
jgi:hypothetical protein